MPKFSISIALWNNLIFTKPCIESIKKAGGDYELIVTDNASWDGTAEWLESIKPALPLTVIRNSENLGFILAHNRALVPAKGEFFIVLNNDTELPPGWLDAIEEKFRNPKVALVGARGQCKTLDAYGTGHPGDRLDYIEGSCLAARTALVRKHGLFDEVYKFGYFEDSDLSLRMRELGYELAVADFNLVHRGAATSNLAKERKAVDVEGYKIRNGYIFRDRWKSYLELRIFMGRILVQRMAAMGDVLLITPILRALKNRHPSTEITVVTGFPEMIRGNPHVSRLELERPLPNTAYDKIYNLDLAYESNPKAHIVKAYADACNLEVDDYRPDIYPTIEEDRWAEATVPRRPFIVFHTGMTAWAGRNWPAAGFQKVADHFARKGYASILVGNLLTPALSGVLDLRQRTSVHTLAAVLRRASLFVGVDSLPMHLAVSQDIPVTSAFGCIAPEYRLPPGLSYMRGATAENVGCLGCHHWLPAPRVSSGCLRDKVYCMNLLTPEQMIAEAETALLEYRKAKGK